MFFSEGKTEEYQQQANNMMNELKLAIQYLTMISLVMLIFFNQNSRVLQMLMIVQLLRSIYSLTGSFFYLNIYLPTLVESTLKAIQPTEVMDFFPMPRNVNHENKNYMQTQKFQGMSILIMDVIPCQSFLYLIFSSSTLVYSILISKQKRILRNKLSTQLASETFFDSEEFTRLRVSMFEYQYFHGNNLSLLKLIRNVFYYVMFVPLTFFALRNLSYLNLADIISSKESIFNYALSCTIVVHFCSVFVD